MVDELVHYEAAVFAGALLSVAVGIVVHEFGHVVAARAVRLPVRLINIGVGPALAHLRMGRAWLVVRAAPVGGYVYAELGPDTTARQRFVMTAGGPGATLLLLLATLLAQVVQPPEYGSAFLGGCALGQLLILAGTLFPAQRRIKNDVSVSDGLRLYRLARGENRGAFARLHAALLRRHLPEGADIPAPSRHLPEIVFQRARRDRRHDAWAQDQVAASMRAILACDDLPEAERGVAAGLLHLVGLHQEVRALRGDLAAHRRAARAG